MRRRRLMAWLRAPRLAVEEARRRAARRIGQAGHARDSARLVRINRSRQARHLLRRLLFAGFGQLHGPGALFAGIDLEEAGAVETARQAILSALDGEFLVARAHEGLSRPLAAAVIIERVDVIISRDQRALQQGFATARGHVPPTLGGPALGILVAQRNTHPARRVVAKAEVRRGGVVPQAHHHKHQRGQQTGDHASGERTGAMGIFRDHLAKLYQFFDDFARAGGGCQQWRRLFTQSAAEIPP